LKPALRRPKQTLFVKTPGSVCCKDWWHRKLVSRKGKYAPTLFMLDYYTAMEWSWTCVDATDRASKRYRLNEWRFFNQSLLSKLSRFSAIYAWLPNTHMLWVVTVRFSSECVQYTE